jgi:hypothetical protein
MARSYSFVASRKSRLSIAQRPNPSKTTPRTPTAALLTRPCRVSDTCPNRYLITTALKNRLSEEAQVAATEVNVDYDSAGGKP